MLGLDPQHRRSQWREWVTRFPFCPSTRKEIGAAFVGRTITYKPFKVDCKYKKVGAPNHVMRAGVTGQKMKFRHTAHAMKTTTWEFVRDRKGIGGCGELPYGTRRQKDKV